MNCPKSVEAYQSYTMKWLGSEPPLATEIYLSDADHKTWYRLSLCVGDAKVTNVIDGRKFLNHNAAFSFEYNSHFSNH